MRLPQLFAEPRSRRDWLVYGCTFGLAAIFGVIAGFDAILRDLLVWQQAVVIAAGVFCWFSLFYRRRYPVAVAVLATVAGTLSPVAGGVYLLALLNLAIRRPWRYAAGFVLVGLITTPIFFLIYPDSTALWLNLLWVAVVTSGVVAWGMYVRARRELVESLRERARQAEADRDLRLKQAREQERTRIAREMHDVLAHRISLVALNAGALEFRPDASSEEVREAAAVVRTNAHLALDELREVIFVLREQPKGELAAKEPPQPTLDNVISLIEESRQSGAEVEFEAGVERTWSIPDSTGRTAYRVIQEGLTNVRKHASGGAAAVALTGSPDEGLTIEVRNRRPLIEPDTGTAIPGIPGSGSGLIGLNERVELAGGRLEHGRQPDGQFRLFAWLPWST